MDTAQMIYRTTWRTRAGKARRIRLYKAWNNLHARLAGNNVAGNGSRPWVGKPNYFSSWREFRAWALACGFSRARCSLDRINPAEGYSSDNCQWLTVAQNTKKMNDDLAAAATNALLPDGCKARASFWFEHGPDGVPF